MWKPPKPAKGKTELDYLNDFLITVANTKSGIRRKIVNLQKYIDTLNMNTASPLKELCPDCDGCGWTEGGKVLQNICRTCDGNGYVNKYKKHTNHK